MRKQVICGNAMKGREHGLRDQTDLVQIPALPFIGPVTLVRLIKISCFTISLSVKYLIHVVSIRC